MSQEFSNHLNNYSFDNFTPQVTKDRNLKIFGAILLLTITGLIIYQIRKDRKDNHLHK